MRSSAFAPLLAVALCAATPAPGRAADIPVDLELVLAVDVSRSMDIEEQQLQRDGYVAALTHPEIVAAIGQGFHGRIALTYVEWAGPEMQTVVMGWQAIDGMAAAETFAAGLAAAPIRHHRGTSISGGLAFAAPLFDGNGFEGARRVIDVSGDGPNNMGIPVEAARDVVVAAGITINGLPIMIRKPPGFLSIDALDVYYEDCVIGGTGAFVVPVQSRAHFAEAIRRKLMLEIAGRPPDDPAPRLVPVATKATDGRIDCLIGEKLRQQWLR